MWAKVVQFGLIVKKTQVGVDDGLFICMKPGFWFPSSLILSHKINVLFSSVTKQDFSQNKFYCMYAVHYVEHQGSAIT